MKFSLHALEDLTADEIHAVRKTATGRRFLIAKGAFSPQIEQKIAKLRDLGMEPTDAALDLAKTDVAEFEKALDSEIAYVQKTGGCPPVTERRVEKSAPALGEGLFGNLTNFPEIPSMVGDIVEKRGKDAEDSDSDDMSDEDRKARGMRATHGKKKAIKYSGGDPFLNENRVRTFDIGETGRPDPDGDGDEDLKGVDTGVDRLGRGYTDQDFIERYASLGGTSGIPAAGGMTRDVGDTRSLAYDPEKFAGDEGNMVGGEDRGGRLGGPQPAGFGLLKEGEEPDTVSPVRLGDGWVMPSAYDAHGPASAKFPDASTRTLKTEVKKRKSVFGNVVFGAHRDSADSFLG